VAVIIISPLRLSMTNLPQHVEARAIRQVNVQEHRGWWLGIKGGQRGVGSFDSMGS
jgi:hypothetical protein